MRCSDDDAAIMFDHLPSAIDLSIERSNFSESNPNLQLIKKFGLFFIFSINLYLNLYKDAALFNPSLL